MPSDLTAFEKGQIVAYKDCRKSYKDISEIIQRPRSTISHFFNKYRADGYQLVDRRNQCGRHRVTCAQTDSLFANESKTYPFKPATIIRRELIPTLERLNAPIPGIHTVRKRLVKRGLKAYSPAVKPKLTEKHELQRYLFAESHINWKDEWNRVIFTDESTFQMGKSGIQYVRRSKSERYEKQNVRSVCNKSVAQVNVWAAICDGNVSDLHFITGKLTSQTYVDTILSQELMNFSRRLFPDVNQYVLQHDNSPVHTGHVVKDWLNAQNINVLDWPPISADLNPIENLWGDMKRQLAFKDEINSVPQLRQHLQQLWQSYRADRQFVVRNSISSMPERCQILYDNHGLYSKY